MFCLKSFSDKIFNSDFELAMVRILHFFPHNLLFEVKKWLLDSVARLFYFSPLSGN